MRGRTFINKYLIIDEAQNLTPKQMKTLITRAGPGHQGRLPRQHRADRHALPHRRQLGPHLRRRPLQGLGALRATSRWRAASARASPTSRRSPLAARRSHAAAPGVAEPVGSTSSRICSSAAGSSIVVRSPGRAPRRAPGSSGAAACPSASSAAASRSAPAPGRAIAPSCAVDGVHHFLAHRAPRLRRRRRAPGP